LVKRYVWLDRDGKARKVEVGVGLSDDRWETITSGLKEGDRVITGPSRALRRLKDGDAVRQTEDKDQPKDEEEADAGKDADG
jgi:HlyD family secretion protein